LSKAIAERADTGETFNFYGDQMAQALSSYVKIRMSPLSGKGKKGGNSRVPTDHPRSVSNIRFHDFGDDQVNFWRDRMIHHFNRI
jgi:hypothetical protein